MLVKRFRSNKLKKRLAFEQKVARNVTKKKIKAAKTMDKIKNLHIAKRDLNKKRIKTRFVRNPKKLKIVKHEPYGFKQRRGYFKLLKGIRRNYYFRFLKYRRTPRQRYYFRALRETTKDRVFNLLIYKLFAGDESSLQDRVISSFRLRPLLHGIDKRYIRATQRESRRKLRRKLRITQRIKQFLKIKTKGRNRYRKASYRYYKRKRRRRRQRPSKHKRILQKQYSIKRFKRSSFFREKRRLRFKRKKNKGQRKGFSINRKNLLLKQKLLFILY